MEANLNYSNSEANKQTKNKTKKNETRQFQRINFIYLFIFQPEKKKVPGIN